ncbi:hypothetical protein BGX28_010436 [Mortierella sp. GBA30]|nr:hypothetical protein BGX28_010436 [Mortierella sp. GBA30]
MNLDRTLSEIEEEYTRLYAEIPDTDEEEWTNHTPEVQESYHAFSLPTPALTATSSAPPSARSSQDNISTLFDQSKEDNNPTPALERLPDGDDEDEAEDEDEERHHPQYYQQTQSDVRPPRMVRVWTPEQSENLKNLIEVYFPGAYRINWVWVAAQMGNTFTRKQCKNKWEIMRRRMGTEDEINLLKRGYQEFGPSWGQIQEKYLPERSRGGISIMWELLETREAEQAEGVTTTRGVYHKRNQSASSTKASSRYGHSREPSKQELAFCSVESKSSQRQRSATTEIAAMDISTPGSARQPKATESHSTLLHSMSSATNTSKHPVGQSFSHEKMKPIGAMNATRHARHRSDATWNMTKKTTGPIRHVRHGSDTVSWNPVSHETWSDRSHPMTWTEPLSRRLEDLVRQHFPNHQKVNWAKISSLMGTNPVVSRDQCKRRWYLVSQQQQQLLHRPSEQAAEMSMIVEADDCSMAIDDTADGAGTHTHAIRGLGIYDSSIGYNTGRVS